jgi:hypothetical protein
VTEILAVDIKNVVVRAEYDGYVTNPADLAFRNHPEPAVVETFIFEDKLRILKIVQDHSLNILSVSMCKSNLLNKKFEIKIIISTFEGQMRI